MKEYFAKIILWHATCTTAELKQTSYQTQSKKNVV